MAMMRAWWVEQSVGVATEGGVGVMEGPMEVKGPESSKEMQDRAGRALKREHLRVDAPWHKNGHVWKVWVGWGGAGD